MCKSCGKTNGCSKCANSSSKDLASLQNELQELRDVVDGISKNAKFLMCGHPILQLQNADDIACFDANSGLGEACWEGWAVCNGNAYTSPNSGKQITTPQLQDKFIVGAGDTYSVGDTGGANSVALTSAQMPVHTHTVVDPGHTHDITDPGHTHAGSSAAHTHTFTGSPHTHTVTVVGVEDHVHGTGFRIIGDGNGGTNFNALDDGSTGNSVGPGGAHTHSASADSSTAGGTVGDASAPVSISSAFIGITETEEDHTDISLETTGEGEAHENRPPFYAVLFVMKL